MSHTVLGNASAAVYNTTQDKTLALTTALAPGSLLVAICGGYGTDGSIDLTDISDSNGNDWDFVKVSAATPSRFALIAWTRINAAMNTSDTVTINMTGTFTRSWAVLRAYAGLGFTKLDSDSAASSGNPQATPALTTSGDGRAIALCFYASESFATDSWANSFVQSTQFNDATNVDTFTVGERTFSGAAGVTPQNGAAIATNWAIVGVTLPEQAMPVAQRSAPVVM